MRKGYTQEGPIHGKRLHMRRGYTQEGAIHGKRLHMRRSYTQEGAIHGKRLHMRRGYLIHRKGLICTQRSDRRDLLKNFHVYFA